ncbi:hypothetical protein WH47_06445 [Habropoda laboriosa]|uniref:ZAD domain-containing protein n=1 Tax=Habropoda laboriosa TaxID=597456 RepID=A0A0L7RCS6_9HYME|nr:PREDICTED: uncharacterized protein LOC108579528 [Habropoda laboriosa]KOC68653.1 hypothetical protein WH47_06445 [Habropoda laboriosa]
METLESSRVCRLCGKQSGISINIFDKNENHVKKINAVLPIMVHEMDLLPKHMCHRCSYKLEEFHKFYVDCLKTDADLKSQLSWMQKEDSKERVGVPMVHIENIRIKIEPPDYDAYEINPIVDNVNYMNSVTFPVNGVRSDDIPDGITYTTYARCGCYCDKADQSNQTVPTNYENRISDCGRINDVREDNTRGMLNCERIEERSSIQTLGKKTKDLRRSRPNLSNFSRSKGKSASTNVNVQKCTIVRNLRPRKGSVDYRQTRKKLSTVSALNNGSRSKNEEARMTTTLSTGLEVTQIKVEKLDDFGGRVLRPRKGTVDYIGPKRKYSRSSIKKERLHSDERSSEKTKVPNIASKLKPSSKRVPKLLDNSIKLSIKKEQLSDLEDMVLDESISAVILPEKHVLNDHVDTVPNDHITNIHNDRVNCSSTYSAQHVGNFSVGNKWKCLRSMSKHKLKSRKISLNRFETEINYPPKYLRSQDVYLRSGKIRKLDNANVSAKKLRRSLRNLTDRGKMTRNLMKAIRGTVTAIKLLDNIKHYCEECNTHFTNKELFKLHACYGH